MPTRRLGKTEQQVPIVGFAGIATRTMSVEDSVKTIEEALDLGVDYIDVAPSYGDAQVKVGEAMKTRRKEFFLACKTLKRTGREAKEELDESLKLLHTDRIDLYQFHALDTREDLETVLKKGGAMELFLEARKAGIVRFIGLTGHNPVVQAQALKEFPFDTVMTPVNFIDRFFSRAETGLIPLAAKNDVGVIAIKATYRSSIPDRETAFRYTLSQNISITVTAGNREEILFAARFAQSFKHMDKAETDAFLAGSPLLGTEICRQCGYCLPCPVNIDIPLLLRLEGYARRYNKDIAIRQYHGLAVKPDACNRCGDCERSCPFSIPIISRLEQMNGSFSA